MQKAPNIFFKRGFYYAKLKFYWFLYISAKDETKTPIIDNIIPIQWISKYRLFNMKTDKIADTGTETKLKTE